YKVNATNKYLLQVEINKKIDSHIDAQIDRKGYSTYKPKNKPDFPMLAHKWEDYHNKIDWETAYVQPKIDGLRCIGTNETLHTRRMKRIKTVPHIANILKCLPPGIK